jgi:hypothetical protein
MMMRGASIVACSILAVCACSDSTDTGRTVASVGTSTVVPEEDGSGVLLDALLTWQRKNLPMEVSEMESDPAEGRTMHAEIRNESDAVTCTGAWGTDDASPLMPFGALAPGATGSTIISYPSGAAGAAPQLRLECAVEGLDVSTMTGLSAEEVGRVLARYPTEIPEASGVVVFSLRWTLAGTWAGVEVNRRVAAVVPVESAAWSIPGTP